MTGVGLLLAHPRVTQITCKDCKKWQFDFKTGRKKERAGIPITREVNEPTPCFKCPKLSGVEIKKPENSIELNTKNSKAFTKYLEWKATNSFPDDEIVRRNAGMIRWIEDSYLRDRSDLTQIIPAMMGGGVAKVGGRR